MNVMSSLTPPEARHEATSGGTLSMPERRARDTSRRASPLAAVPPARGNTHIFELDMVDRQALSISYMQKVREPAPRATTTPRLHLAPPEPPPPARIAPQAKSLAELIQMETDDERKAKYAAALEKTKKKIDAMIDDDDDDFGAVPAAAAAAAASSSAMANLPR